MARKTEERIEDLKRLRESALTKDVEAVLKKALKDRSNLIVAEAAKIVADRTCAALVPDLLEAFSRLFEDSIKTDSKCWGKTAIVKALTSLDYSEAAPFLRASAHIQMEPVWGGKEDAAIHLRATAVLALVQCPDLSRPEILRHLVNALADPEDTVRIEAVRALEQMNGDESALLLRLKAHAGDKRASVVGQVFDSLLALESERAVEFVARFLESPAAETCDEAALSLGTARLPSAVTVLIEAWQRARNPVILRALSSSRDEVALLFLLNLVREGISRDATAAEEALNLHDSPEVRARVEVAKAGRN